jgi:hypothetical protein
MGYAAIAIISAHAKGGNNDAGGYFEKIAIRIHDGEIS